MALGSHPRPSGFSLAQRSVKGFALISASRLFNREWPYSQDQLGRIIENCQAAFPANHPFASSRLSWAELLQSCKTDGLLVTASAQTDAKVDFLHGTIHEYLTGIALARPAVLALPDGQSVEEAAEQLAAKLTLHVDDPAWREVELLALGYVGLVQKHTSTGEGPSLAGAAIERLVLVDQDTTRAEASWN
jgi:hypothetical protein